MPMTALWSSLSGMENILSMLPVVWLVLGPIRPGLSTPDRWFARILRRGVLAVFALVVIAKLIVALAGN